VVTSQKSKNGKRGMKDQIENQVIIDIAKHPKIYEHLKKSAEINFRTIEQQALYYIWGALNIEKNGKK
jgi:hypothetical protein